MKQTEALESSNGIYQKLEAFIRVLYEWIDSRSSTFHRFRFVVFSRFCWIFSLANQFQLPTVMSGEMVEL
jgi:hypothetical protein